MAAGAAPMTMAQAERHAIVVALRFFAGNTYAAAAHLGIGKTTVYRKMKEYDIEKDEYMGYREEECES